MSTHPLAPSLPRPELRPGQAVHVNARAAWLPATVVSVAHTAIGVTLSLPTGGPLTRTVAPWVVRPADGRRLEPVHRLRIGDKVAAADGAIHTIAATPWQGRDGWWVITYAHGEPATVPAGAVLRLVNPTPTVTVSETPLNLTAGRRRVTHIGPAAAPGPTARTARQPLDVHAPGRFPCRACRNRVPTHGRST